MATPNITLYIDLVSPFAYLAFHLLHRSPLLKITTINPVFLGGIMRETSNRPPLAVPLKGEYTFHDLHRQARIHNIPICPTKPEGFPLNTVLAQRALCMLQKQEEFVEAVRALYEAHWVHGRRVDDEGVVRGVLEGVLGREKAERVLEQAKGEEAKKKLTENTKEAVGKGCFGLPWFVVRNRKGQEDVWWGFDHLKQVEAFVDGEEDGGRLSRL
ncbi:putative 2-hydroxychromene-2-carboxylate isomerase [Wilcoxina mikolae CBS 423.85]|nr:putative 2-hydroxychromene-2-carboxylate isomerase [Wilcoxina mikolae CBS 423.85]